ncbi:MmgE/PrpD family protein [Salinigranum halophilum]|uniref:MmgE/PrpD family protein n=1 Tax=Salinigranum halophilum TaxID=2565931 RepID=UPI0010A9440C|nr:MmgE/PrpD family protein [Salinigranum halophilum]
MPTGSQSAEHTAPSLELAQFVSSLSYEDLPPDAVHLAERCFVDTVGVGIAGATAAAGEVAAETIAAAYGSGPASLFGRTGSAPVAEAAFVNGTAAHALDYDDVSNGMDGHPSTTMVGPIIAAAEAYDATGRELLTAYVAGFETQCYIARPNLRDRTGVGLHPVGWHPTAIFGTFGATAAVANLLGLTVQETHQALNIAASKPSGIKRNFGSLMKPMHAGQSGAAGVRAALLAAHGGEATQDAIEHGFYPVYADVDELDLEVLPALGDDWSILEDGVDIKLYPSCYATHTAIHATATLADEHRIDPDDVERIHLDVNGMMEDLLVYDDPETEAQAKFSIPWAVAAAVTFDYIGIETFEPATLQTPAAQVVRERVTYERDPDLVYGTREMTVTIETTDDEAYTLTEDQPPATHHNPLSDAKLREKFIECATRTLDREAAEAAYERLDTLRDQEDVAAVVEHLS